MPTDPVALGLLLGLGLTLIVLAIAVPPDPEPDPAMVARRRSRLRDRPGLPRIGVTALLAVAAAVATWMIFRLPVLSVAAVCAVAVPRHLGDRTGSGGGRSGGRRDPAEIAETASTVARWVETVRDYLLTAATLSEAMILASGDVRGPHRDAFARFAATLTGAGGFQRAAEDLAADLDNALADKALVALWLGNRDGGDLHDALGLLATSAQTEADNARRIQAGLAGTHRLVRIVLVLCAGILVLSLVAFRENFDIYRTPSGQLLLTAGLAIIAATWWAIWRLSKVTVPERLILVRPHRGTGW